MGKGKHIGDYQYENKIAFHTTSYYLPTKPTKIHEVDSSGVIDSAPDDKENLAEIFESGSQKMTPYKLLLLKSLEDYNKVMRCDFCSAMLKFRENIKKQFMQDSIFSHEATANEL